MVSVFLHQRITTTEEVQGLIDRQEYETESLDFKGTFWSSPEEAAKDSAAFANNVGGDLIIGVGELNALGPIVQWH